MSMTYEQAHKKAAEYLALCTGYPKNVQVKLYKTDQKFNKRKNCHEIVFTMYVRQPEQVDMDAPLSEESSCWESIRRANQEVGLIENKQVIRFFKADFNRFASILMKQLGYSQDYSARMSNVYQSHDSSNNRDIYDMRLHIEKPSKPPELIHVSNDLPMLRELQLINKLN